MKHYIDPYQPGLTHQSHNLGHGRDHNELTCLAIYLCLFHSLFLSLDGPLLG
jgi:hypothetical protein